MYDIITIGSATRDVFLISKAFRLIRSNEFQTGVGECVSLGSKIEVDDLILTTGGGGTNSAATFSQLGGYKTAVICRIGDDESGRDVLADLERFKVGIDLVKKIKDGKTGYGTQLMASTGERSILVHRGVSAELSEKDISWTKLKSSWIYMTSLGGNTALALKIVKHARKNKIRVAYNPGNLELKKGLRALSPLLAYLTVFNINMEEAQMLLKTDSRDVEEICKKIATPGLMFILTDGPNGSYAHLDGTTWFARPRNLKAKSRTGAGDAFGSALVAALMAGKGIDEALQIGTINAESVVQIHGAKNGILKTWPSSILMKKIKVKTI